MGIIDPTLDEKLKSERYHILPIKITINPRYNPAEIEVSFKPGQPAT